MKKLSLGKLRLLSDEVLDRSQLSSIYGGSGYGSQDPQCCLRCNESHMITVTDCSYSTASYYCGSLEHWEQTAVCFGGPCDIG